jgi:mRNA-degrading endonuclease RelE of RelBE toxin-antitoxin system
MPIAMISIAFKPSFVRKIAKLPKRQQEEVIEKIGLFKDPENHPALKVHKLQGKLKNFYSFSVDFKHRIVFEYLSDTEVVLLAFGDHEVYE